VVAIARLCTAGRLCLRAGEPRGLQPDARAGGARAVRESANAWKDVTRRD